MRTRHVPTLTAPSPSKDVDALQEEIAGWRQEFATLGQERANWQCQAVEKGESAAAPGAAQRAIAALDLQKQRLIWSIRESEQTLRAVEVSLGLQQRAEVADRR